MFFIQYATYSFIKPNFTEFQPNFNQISLDRFSSKISSSSVKFVRLRLIAFAKKSKLQIKIKINLQKLLLGHKDKRISMNKAQINRQV